MTDFRELGRQLSNWGRWGDADRLGTLNHIRPEHVVAAARLVRTGRIFDLGIPVSSQGIQMGSGGRNNPVHHMSIMPHDLCGRTDGMMVTDDHVFMPLQSVTQWDGLAHVGYDERFYNNVAAASVTAMQGSTELSIDQIAQRGIAGRGVVLDIAALKGVERLPAGQAITASDLEAAAARQHVTVGAGDILLLRTGWLRTFTIDKQIATYWNGEPGLDLSCAQWLHQRDIAVVGSDNWGIEVIQPNDPNMAFPVHCVLIRDMGMTLGEIFDLDALAASCAEDNVWDFFFSAPPLKVVGGVGSPITPLAIK